MDTDYDAIVIGAGHNGLVASWYLARAGFKVSVLEARSQVGGAAVTEEMFPGYRLSSCAMYLHMLQSKIIRDLDLRRHGLEILPVDPFNTSLFDNGRVLREWVDGDRYEAEVGAISRHDAAALKDYRKFQLAAAQILNRHFLSEPPTLTQLVDACRGPDDEAILSRLLTGSLTGLVNEFFESPEVRATQTTPGDLGDPEAPGSLLGAAYFWLGMLTPREDTGVIRGGMGRVSDAMASAAAEVGVTITTGAEVEQIVVEQGAAVGVVLRDGQMIRSRVVLSNADPKRTVLKLAPDHAIDDRTRRATTSIGTRAGSMKFTAAISELPDLSSYLGPTYDPTEIAGIRICPSVEHSRTAWFEAMLGLLPRRPVLHAQIPTIYDPGAAPSGHVISMWVQFAPVHPSEGSWKELGPVAGERIIDLLTGYAPNFRSSITNWAVSTPEDLEQRVGLTDGQIRHVDMVPSHYFANRPLPGWGYRTPIDRLYLCGAGAHPGGEVTGAPGHNAAHVVIRDLGGGA